MASSKLSKSVSHLDKKDLYLFLNSKPPAYTLDELALLVVKEYHIGRSLAEMHVMCWKREVGNCV